MHIGQFLAGTLIAIAGLTTACIKHFYGKGGGIHGLQAQMIGIWFAIAGFYLILISIKKKKR